MTYKAPEPKGEHFFAESFDKGTLDGWDFKDIYIAESWATAVTDVYTAFIFLSPNLFHRWVLSKAKKEGIDEEIAKYDGKSLFLELLEWVAC